MACDLSATQAAHGNVGLQDLTPKGPQENNSMTQKAVLLVLAITFLAASCGSLEKKSSLIAMGDEKEKVLKIMGPPDDRQLKGNDEAWQYCQTGAGFGYRDYRIIWLHNSKVTGINSYKSTRPGTSCMTDILPIRWQDAPHEIIEFRNR
jgi:hypothetical protein